jgi:uncharacterized protein (DUF697 family)
MGVRDYFQRLFTPREDANLRHRLGELQREAPVPVFWLFGKTQSGKTSLIRFLTGAEDAEIGHGFKPMTRFSREYDFPSEEAPLLTFLDTRGLDEPGYDSKEDIERFHDLTHVVIVTVRVTDHAQEHVLEHLRRIRQDRPARPVVLVLTCLHEAYPQQQHPQTYPFTRENVHGEGPPSEVHADLWRCIVEQRRRFAEVADRIVPVDLTRPEEGFHESNYGGAFLQATLRDLLPAAYQQTFERVEELIAKYQDNFARPALPYILGYSTLAATAGGFPIPWVNLLILPALQMRMVEKLAEVYSTPQSAARFLESAAGIGLTRQQAIREFAKLLPGVGTLAGAALAGRATYALGQAFCYFHSTSVNGHVPNPTELKHYFEQQLKKSENLWKDQAAPAPEGTT